MNRQQFIGYVQSPEQLNAESSLMLEQLIKEYPYCQTAEILYTLNLNKENNFKFGNQLKTASAYAIDRKLFRHQLGMQKSGDRQETIAKPEPQPKEVTPDTAEVQSREKKLINLIGNLKEEVSSILQETNSSPLSDLASKLEDVIRDHESTEPKIKPDIKDYNFEHLKESGDKSNKLKENEDLINKFIDEEPKIEATEKAEFFDPVDFAKHSLEDKQEVVSETLAKINLNQGNTEKAIKIYERLILLYPEKSSFFAAQIEKIRKDQTN